MEYCLYPHIPDALFNGQFLQPDDTDYDCHISDMKASSWDLDTSIFADCTNSEVPEVSGNDPNIETDSPYISRLISQFQAEFGAEFDAAAQQTLIAASPPLPHPGESNVGEVVETQSIPSVGVSHTEREVRPDISLGDRPVVVPAKQGYHCKDCPELVFHTVFQTQLHASRTGHRPFECTTRGCSSTFKRQDCLIRHTKQYHSSSKPARHLCGICLRKGKVRGFTRAYQLVQHREKDHGCRTKTIRSNIERVATHSVAENEKHSAPAQKMTDVTNVFKKLLGEKDVAVQMIKPALDDTDDAGQLVKSLAKLFLMPPHEFLTKNEKKALEVIAKPEDVVGS